MTKHHLSKKSLMQLTVWMKTNILVAIGNQVNKRKEVTNV